MKENSRNESHREINTEVYERIKNGEYEERIPCKMLKISKQNIKDILKTEKDLLYIERVPRVMNSSIFGETSRKRGIHIESETMPKDSNSSWVMLDKKSEKGFPAELVLGYEYFTHTELLKRAGISETEYQSSYNRVGSIIHLNLKDESLKHKEIISKTLINKIKDCNTVIRKASNIQNTFRNIEIEHLQGVPLYKTIHKENGLRFSIDYDKVYWNSKLQKEREILGSKILNGQTVCDMFCGVGPFSILALIKGATVWANDLNPASIINFQESIILNRKVLGIKETNTVWNEGISQRVHLYNLDAREFLLKVTYKETNRRFNHYILNLPELTLEYVKHFVELEKTTEKLKEESTVHAYFFIRTDESAKERIEHVLGRKIEGSERFVRKVAPSKDMWVVSFLLI